MTEDVTGDVTGDMSGAERIPDLAAGDPAAARSRSNREDG